MRKALPEQVIIKSQFDCEGEHWKNSRIQCEQKVTEENEEPLPPVKKFHAMSAAVRVSQNFTECHKGASRDTQEFLFIVTKPWRYYTSTAAVTAAGRLNTR